jgi:hypothetical protein
VELEGAAMVQSGDASTVRARWWRDLEPLIRLLSATIVIGGVTGAVVGGLGGRLAMRILFLTSDDSVKGLTSDDGFEIGRFDLSDTAGLVVIAALIGVIAALLYLVARPFLAGLGRSATAVMAVFYGVVGGALMVHTDGVDFTVLEPPALAIALFVAICAAFGAIIAHVIGAAASDQAWPQRRRWWLLGPPLLVLLIPPFFVVAVAALGLNWAATAPGRNERAWHLVQLAARLVMIGVLVVGAVDLVRDTATLT